MEECGNVDDIRRLLQCVVSPSGENIKYAEKVIVELQERNFSGLLIGLLNVLYDESEESCPYKIAAGHILQSSLHSGDPSVQDSISTRWASLTENTKQTVKSFVMRGMASVSQQISMISARILASIARIEVLLDDSANIYETYSLFLSQNSATLAIATLESLGVFCTLLIEETDYNFMKDSDAVRSLILMRLNAGEPIEVRLAALKCIQDSLEALEYSDIVSILKAIVMSGKEDEVVVNSIAPIYKIIGLFYEKVSGVIGDLIAFVTSLQSRNVENINIQIVEFWRVLAQSEWKHGGSNVKNSLNNILQFLLVGFGRGNRDSGGGMVWDMYDASISCIETLSRYTDIELVDYDPFYNFVVQRMNALDPVAPECLKSVLDKEITDGRNLISFVSNIIVDNIANPNFSYLPFMECLAKICETNFDKIDTKFTLPRLISEIEKMLQARDDPDRVICATEVVRGMSCYISSKKESGLWRGTNCLSSYYNELLVHLTSVVKSQVPNDYRMNSAVFSCLSSFISAASDDVSLLLVVLLKDDLIPMTKRNLDYCVSDPSAFLEVGDQISQLVIMIQKVLSVRGEGNVWRLEPVIMELFIQLLQSGEGCVCGDVYIALTEFCTITSYFTANFVTFIPFIIRDMKSSDVYVARAAINLIGDIANVLSQGFLIFSGKFMPELVRCLTSDEISREVKPVLLSVIGDVALSLGYSFIPYLDMSLGILGQAASIRRKFDEGFVDAVRRNAVIMIDCIIVATGFQQRTASVLRDIISHIKVISIEDVDGFCTKELTDLIGDILRWYGAASCDMLREPWVSKYANSGKP